MAIMDLHVDCMNGADEFFLDYGDKKYGLRPPAVIYFKSGKKTKTYELFTGICPETHFHCSPTDYCLPVFMRCNGVYDCMRHEDETGCERFKCKGFYRCAMSRVCLHSTHLCDGISQCPQHDDEAFCKLILKPCPNNCTCYNYILLCDRISIDFRQHVYAANKTIAIDIIKELRYLHITESKLHVDDTSTFPFLIHLGLPNCHLRRILVVHMPNLHSLDLSNNLLQTVDWSQISGYRKLRVLSLSGNPMGKHIFVNLKYVQFTMTSLFSLDISGIILKYVHTSVFKALTNLKVLNMSGCGIENILHDDKQVLTNLRDLTLKGSLLPNFPRDLFRGMIALSRVAADNPKLCCPVMFPLEQTGVKCSTTSQDLSACDSLLQKVEYRVILYLFAVLALGGNIISFIQRVCMEKTSARHGFAVFVIHLCVSDFLMGLYLALIGVVDGIFQDEYMWHDSDWKHSLGCNIAGVLCFVSSEVSAAIIFLITLDRYLVFRFPFSHFHFSVMSANIAITAIWIVGFTLCAIPLLPIVPHWEVYSRRGTCFSLPFENYFPGYNYIFSIVVILNFVLFLFVAFGQIFIYFTIKANTMSFHGSANHRSDINIARRLVAIAVSDFLCWFPVGLTGILASTGTTIPKDVITVVSISVMPLNSALNPLWYTFNMAIEKFRLKQEEQLLLTLKSL